MWRFKGKNVDDPMHQSIVVVDEEFGNNLLIALKNFIESLVNCFLFVLDGMIEDNGEPVFTNVQLCDLIVLDDLKNKVVGSVEDGFEAIIFIFFVLIDFFQNHLPHRAQNFKQFIAYF